MCRNIISRLYKNKDLDRLKQLQQLEQLKRLQQLEYVQSLETISSFINFSSKSYDEVEIKPNSIIYCDPPYENTASYLKDFDHKKFWQWARSNPNPVYVSEYSAPNDFEVVAAFRHKKTNSQTTTDSVEKLFANKAGIERLKAAKQ